MVNEEKKAEKVIEKSTTTDSGTGDKPTAPSIVEQAKSAAERMEAANEKREALLAREEELEARRTLGGQSTGAAQVEKPKEDTPKEYAEKVMKGEVPLKA